MSNEHEQQGGFSAEGIPGPLPAQNPTSLRRHRQQTERRLIVVGFGLMFLVGGALVWFFYGIGAMLMAWFFLSGGVALFGGLYLILKLMEKWTREKE